MNIYIYFFINTYSGNRINSKFVALHESRGIESDEHKLFMRITGFNNNYFLFLFFL